MAIEKVDFEIKVHGNFLEIVPKDAIKDNSIYEIKLYGLRDKHKENVDNSTIKFVTAMTPAYCSIMDVASLLEIVDIPEDIVLYNIREASKYADYIYEYTYKEKRIPKNIPFAVKEFTRYKAAKDCLLKIYMSLVTDKVTDGQLGEVKFKVREQIPDFKKLLEYLDQEINKWLDAIKGYDLEGRAKMKTAIRGYNHGGYNQMSQYESRLTPKGVPLGTDRSVY